MRRSLLVLLVVGCGGRDPLYGVSDNPAPPGDDASVSSGTGGDPNIGGASGGTPGSGGVTASGGTPGSGGVTASGGTPGSGGITASGGAPGSGGGPGTLPPDAGAIPPGPRRDAGAPPRDAAPPGTCSFPKCVAALQADCAPAGMCVQERLMSGGSLSSNVCYSNGVKVMSSLMGGGGRNFTSSIKVFKADGTLCYSLDPQPRGAGVNAVNYRDASGNVVATATIDRNFLAVSCTGQTTPQIVQTSCQPGMAGSIGGCGNGTCM
jgi:hypothetical protein